VRAATLRALSWVAALGASGAAIAQPVQEYELKAAYLYNFALFAEWPAAAFAAPASRFAICVLGQSPFGRSLAALERKPVQSRPIAVRSVPTPAAARDCHVLFVVQPDARRMSEIAAALGDAPVLTVADSDHDMRAGAVVTLVPRGARIGFTVDLDAARRARLRISARLLRLAAAVHDGAGER
jgi:hypothetical protein